MAESAKIRYAVVGIGHIAQVAVLPAFRHARKNAVLSALVTGDVKKSMKVAERYASLNPQLEVVPYESYTSLLDSGKIDAVYIATPNHRHTEFVLPALERGVHVLCEKPLALSIEECRAMMHMAAKTGARFMVAYRLHFEPANLRAIETVKQGTIGEARYFNSVFSFQLRDEENIRLRSETGGGPLWDIGVYCINAARYLFQAEPTVVTALGVGDTERRFDEVEEMVGAVMKFPGDRLATFTCSFGAAETATFDVFGTKGNLRLENAFEYTTPRELRIKVDSPKRTKTIKFKKSDQFAPEILYFSECIQNHKEPTANGLEGLADVRIILALYESMQTGRAIRLANEKPLQKKKRPQPSQKLVRPPVKKVKTIDVRAPN